MRLGMAAILELSSRFFQETPNDPHPYIFIILIKTLIGFSSLVIIQSKLIYYGLVETFLIICFIIDKHSGDNILLCL